MSHTIHPPVSMQQTLPLLSSSMPNKLFLDARSRSLCFGTCIVEKNWLVPFEQPETVLKEEAYFINFTLTRVFIKLTELFLFSSHARVQAIASRSLGCATATMTASTTRTRKAALPSLALPRSSSVQICDSVCRRRTSATEYQTATTAVMNWVVVSVAFYNIFIFWNGPITSRWFIAVYYNIQHQSKQTYFLQQHWLQTLAIARSSSSARSREYAFQRHGIVTERLIVTMSLMNPPHVDR